MEITNQIIESHGLKASEFENIKKLLKRDPNLLELGIFSAMWNEHCCYKTSKKWLKKLPTDNAIVIQGPGENAGIIDLEDNDGIAFKIESHNHPSYIEPFNGSATGVLGGYYVIYLQWVLGPLLLLTLLGLEKLQQTKQNTC